MPTAGVSICADADPAGRHWVTWFWLVIICIEAVLLGLSVHKGVQSYRAGLGGGLMTNLMKDSVIYFAVYVYSFRFVEQRCRGEIRC